MKYKLTILLLFISIINLSSQVVFENGYLIDKNGKQIECLIKNADWKNTPQKFVYKLKENSLEQVGVIEDYDEFGVERAFRFKRFAVSIDRSSNFNEKLSQQQRAVFEKDTLYLETLVDGPVSLYFYQNDNLHRFFYQKENEEITQLVYKKYLIDGKVRTNNRFRQQLINHLNCEDSTNTDQVSYTRKDLITYFEIYNSCMNYDFTTFKKKKTKLFNIGLKLEVINQNLQVLNTFTNPHTVTKFKSSNIFQAGISVEFVLPFNKGKWSLLFEPSLQNFSIENEEESFEHNSIEIPTGIRYYIYLNENSKFYLNGLYIMDWFSTSTFKYVSFGRDKELTSDKVLGNFALGAGYIFNRFGIEFRYKFGKNLLERYIRSKTVFRGPSLAVFIRMY